MREVALDTETTGLSHKDGHRITEIGCVELIHRIPTGRTFHCYVNPERDVSPGASAVSGLTYDFLKEIDPKSLNKKSEIGSLLLEKNIISLTDE